MENHYLSLQHFVSNYRCKDLGWDIVVVAALSTEHCIAYSAVHLCTNQSLHAPHLPHHTSHLEYLKSHTSHLTSKIPLTSHPRGPHHFLIYIIHNSLQYCPWRLGLYLIYLLFSHVCLAQVGLWSWPCQQEKVDPLPLNKKSFHCPY